MAGRARAEHDRREFERTLNLSGVARSARRSKGRNTLPARVVPPSAGGGALLRMLITHAPLISRRVRVFSTSTSITPARTSHSSSGGRRRQGGSSRDKLVGAGRAPTPSPVCLVVRCSGQPVVLVRGGFEVLMHVIAAGVIVRMLTASARPPSRALRAVLRRLAPAQPAPITTTSDIRFRRRRSVAARRVSSSTPVARNVGSRTACPWTASQSSRWCSSDSG